MSHGAVGPVSFHMPGHKGKAFYVDNGYGEFLDAIMDCDITEIPGADNLFQAEEIIKVTMEKYKSLYGSVASYLLINGSSAGILAAILSTVTKGGKLVMARNCHKSAFNALSLGDITPVYAFPESVEEYGILGKVSAEEIAKCLDENPEAEAVILPSPNYYGICSDINKIAEEVHKRGKILIVDQAHGAHLKFFDEKYGFPKPAETQGADIVINSIHKTLGSFGQTALLNVCSGNVDLITLEDKLQVVESSSPSYPMMATLDINADILLKDRETLMGQWAENIEWFYEESTSIPGLKVMEGSDLDKTKLNLDMSAYGLNGNELEELLMERNIFIELVAGNVVMCMTGIGNKRSDFEKLIDALKEISSTRCLALESIKEQPKSLTKKLQWKGVPVKKEAVHVEEAEGRVCAMSIIPYPPGIPIACPGEVLDKELLEYIKERRLAGEKVIGLSEELTIQVGKI
ncbi:MAG: aminotransferase class V-fold PLP-dependent enzyme [Firmicutes bacterium]|nr:aminotransferase class V-fold PLP-dependent enzyme [Bacillota bacterium]